MIKKAKKSTTRSRYYDQLIIYYLLFGALHEVAHLSSAAILLWSGGYIASLASFWDGLVDSPGGKSAGSVLFQALVARSSTIPLIDDACHVGTLVRHAGWIFSTVLALALSRLASQQKNQVCTIAATLTALEAISTDLFGINQIPIIFGASVTSSYTTFLCGNFGLILINSIWTTADNGQHALDLLQRMANITMMRGAQSGGVVTYKHSGNAPIVGIRCRVVNKKRTDLSKLVRGKVQRQVFPLTRRLPLLPESSPGMVQTFSGHTRFATSSKATIDGTHPQRWTPPAYRRVYNFNIVPNGALGSSSSAASTDFARSTRVENYVTHNGDFDFYDLHGKTYDLESIQPWLELTTGANMPATVDSACIAGLVDLIRCQGSFALAARYAITLGLPSSKIVSDAAFAAKLPTNQDYEDIAAVFEKELDIMMKEDESLESISSDARKRQVLASKVTAQLLREPSKTISVFSRGISGRDEEDGRGGLRLFATTTVDAFFDNDLFNTMKIFLAGASGSFGLCITSSLDAQRQICLAARGQTMSIAFYPAKGIITYGSEQAAVKAGMTVDLPRGVLSDNLEKSHLDVDNDDLRLDLDDLGGEICLLDWGERLFRNPAISPPNREVAQKHSLMNRKVNIYLVQEIQKAKKSDQLYHRMTRLTRNQFIKPLLAEPSDPVLRDIQDIPRICRQIQEDWRNLDKTRMSFNRLTAWNLARCIRKKMNSYVDGSVKSHRGAVDILVTGCEVSLWLGEAFACDLQKAFPGLNIMSVSSNKLLGLYGQEMSIPSIGYPMSEKTTKLDDAIVIIISHSGGTFSPLALSNLLNTNSQVFCVTSEWDVQIGKQLRNMHNEDDDIMLLFNSRVFTTEVGIRPAEPCSISVAATQQLLTCIFEHICIIILSNQHYRHASDAVITEQDLRILERCNQDNIDALEELVGVDSHGDKLVLKENIRAERELRDAGSLWADHILENARAYIMTFIYIVGTVVSGYPVASGIAVGVGLENESVLYFLKFIDALIYFFLPQINVIILRIVQRRALRHRMVGRTVVIADCPWVSQAADAFLSKIFAVSYSIAGLNVLSGNPADHFVHRHTHRVVRGSLILCGRPDGRLSALTSLEASCCLSVNQASSIQSLGSTAESITIGHNPFKLPLSARAIFLDRYRPLFLCEKMLGQIDNESMRRRNNLELSMSQSTPRRKKQQAIIAFEDVSVHKSTTVEEILSATAVPSLVSKDIEHMWGDLSRGKMRKSPSVTFDDIPGARKASTPTSTAEVKIPVGGTKQHKRDGTVAAAAANTKPDRRAGIEKRRSSTALLGAYMNLQKDATRGERTLDCSGHIPMTALLDTAIRETKWTDNCRDIFALLDENGDGVLNKTEFVTGFHKLKPNLSEEQLECIFDECDVDDNGVVSLAEFIHLMKMPEMDFVYMIQPSIRDAEGVIQVVASEESYFGESCMQGVAMSQFSKNAALTGATKSQDFSQELYESRIASLQRFVAMTVMFHQMGSQVEGFFRRFSLGFLGYRFDRTHSIMRIATTASPVSGADVRERMRILQMLKQINHAVHVISVAWLRYKRQKDKRHLQDLEQFVEEQAVAGRKLERRMQITETNDRASSSES